MRIPSGVTDQYVYFVAVDVTDGFTRETGLSSFTVYRSRDGGTATIFTTPTVNETDATNMPGVYELLLDEDMTITAGNQSEAMAFHITHASMRPVTIEVELYRPSVTAGTTLTVAAGVGSANVTAMAANVLTAAAINAGAITSAKFAASAINAAAIATDAITAAKIAADAIGASELAADAVAEIADGVWDEVASGHITAGTYGLIHQGLRSNTAQAGAATTITLDASASATNEIYTGNWIALVNGTGVGQTRRISAYNGTTKVATVNTAWTTNPASGTRFVITPSGNVSGVVGSITSIGAGGITASSFASGAIDAAAIAADAIGASELAADAATEIGTAVWATAARTLTAATNITSTGGTTFTQTGDSFVRLGAPAGASVSADIATIDTEVGVIDGIVDNILIDTAEIGAAGAGLTVLATQASVDVIDGIVDDILVDTAEIGAAGAGLTALATQASVDTIDGIVDSILVDTAEIGAAGAGLTEAGGTGDHLTGIPSHDVNVASMDANVITASVIATDAVDADALAADAISEINVTVDTALSDIGLDHLVSAAVIGADITDNSIVAKLVSASVTADWDDYVNTTESLQALRDRGDSAWVTATGFATQASVDTIDGIVDDILVDTAEIGAAGAGLTVLATQASVDTIDGIVDDILVDTAEIGAAGAGLTVLATQASVDTIDGIVDSILVDTGTTLDGKIDTIDGIVDDILVDTGTTLDGKIDTIDGIVDSILVDTGAIETDTQDIQSRLPAALVSGRIDSNVGAISNDATAADNLEAMYDGTGYASDDTAPASRAQVDGLGASSGAALTFEALEDNASVAIKGVSSSGTPTGTFTNTEADDGTYLTITDASDIDWIFGFSVGGVRQATSLSFTGYLNGANDAMFIQAYDFVGGDWETRASLPGQAGTTDAAISATLLSKHTGTGSEAGKVYIRFEADGAMTSPVLAIDEMVVEAVVSVVTVGYVDAAVWVDTVNGTAGTVADVNGVADNPVASLSDARTIADAKGLVRFHLLPGSSDTLATSYVGYEFMGHDYDLDLGSQDIDSSLFINANISGLGRAVTLGASFTGCHFDGVTVDPSQFAECGFAGTLMAGPVAGEFLFTDCFSEGAGSGSPTLDFSGVAASPSTGVNNRRWSGGVTYTLAASCTLSHEVVTGGVTEITTGGADCEIRGITHSLVVTLTGAETVQFAGVTGDVTLSGTTTGASSINLFGVTADVTDSTAGDGITLNNDSVSRNTVNAEADTALSDYDPPTRAEATSDKAEVLTRLGTPVGADIVADLATIDGIVDNILIDTAEIGAAGAGLTEAGGTGDQLTAIPSHDVNVASMDANVITASVIATGAVDADALAADAVAEINDTVDTAISDAALATAAALATVDGIVDSILVDTAEIGAAGAGLTALATQASVDTIDGIVDGILVDTDTTIPGLISGLNDISTAQVNAEVDTALADIHLDHLLAVADADTPADNSIVAKLAASGATADWSTFVNTDDSLQAISESGGGAPTADAIADAVWNEAQGDHVAAGSFGEVATEVASILVDTAEIGAAGAGLTVLATQASVDTIDGIVDDILVDTSTTLDGKIDTIDGIVDNILIDTAEIGAAGAGLTAIPWNNASWDAEVQSEVDDALTAAGTSTHSAADVWSVATRLLTAGTNIALAKGVGVTGFNDLSTAQVNTEVDTALADYDAPTKAELDAGFAALNDVSASDLLTTQMTEAYAADGVAPTLAQALFAIQQMVGDFSITGTTLTVKKLDGSTAAMTFTLDDATTPTSRTRTT